MPAPPFLPPRDRDRERGRLIRLSRSSWRLTSAARAEILVREKPPSSARSTACWGTAVLRVRALLLHLPMTSAAPGFMRARNHKRFRHFSPGIVRPPVDRTVVCVLDSTQRLLGTRHREASPGPTLCGSMSSGTTTDRPVLTTPGRNAGGADEKNAARAKKSNQPSGNRPRPRYTRHLISVFSGVP